MNAPASHLRSAWSAIGVCSVICFTSAAAQAQAPAQPRSQPQTTVQGVLNGTTASYVIVDTPQGQRRLTINDRTTFNVFQPLDPATVPAGSTLVLNGTWNDGDPSPTNWDIEWEPNRRAGAFLLPCVHHERGPRRYWNLHALVKLISLQPFEVEIEAGNTYQTATYANPNGPPTLDKYTGPDPAGKKFILNPQTQRRTPDGQTAHRKILARGPKAPEMAGKNALVRVPISPDGFALGVSIRRTEPIVEKTPPPKP